MTQLEEEGRELPMPPIYAGRYLFDAMISLRPLRMDGMGSQNPPDWTEINAFAEATLQVTEVWEKTLLMEMCKAYILGRQEGTEVLSMPPIERGEEEDEEDG